MNPTFVPVSGFYGREEELGWLRGLWDQATGGGPNQPPGGPRMAVILAESGLGKSRLVQALYQQLTTDPQWDPPEVNYWPDAFDSLHNQLRVNPDLKDHEPQGPPRFLWLGMRWQPPGERNLEERNCALPEARHALQSHVDTAKARMGSWKSFLSRSGWSIARKVGEELLDSAMDELIPFKNLVMKGVETAREMARDRQMSGLTAHDRAEKQVADAAEELQNQLREVLSGRGALPAVLWLDDAQWADAITLRFLRGLWYEASQKKWPLLVVITHWERDWLELAVRQDREENALPRYRDMPDFASLVLKPIPDQPLQEYLGRHLPGLTTSQRKLLLEKAGGNFLSMVENVGFLLKTKGNFEQKDTTRPLSPAGEKTVTRWESDRAKRVEQRFHDLEEEVRRLLGWSSRMGIRFLQEVVDELARRQGEELDAGRLLGSCIDPLAILAEVNPHLWEFRDRAFHQVASQYFADMDSGLEEDLNEVLRERLGIWIDWAFDEKGELVEDSPLSSLGSSERRDLLGMAMSLYPLEGDNGSLEYRRGLRARLLALQADAEENLWDKVRQEAERLESVDWQGLPEGTAGADWMERLCHPAKEAGANQLALSFAQLLLATRRKVTTQNETEEAQENLLGALALLGGYEVEFGQLSQAEYFFLEMDEIAKQLYANLETTKKMRSFSFYLIKLGDFERFVKKNTDNAIKYYTKGLKIRRQIHDQLGTSECLRDIWFPLYKIVRTYLANEDVTSARPFAFECCEISFDIRENLDTSEGNLLFWYSITDLGKIELKEKNLETAKKLFDESFDLISANYKADPSPKNLRHLVENLYYIVKLIRLSDGFSFQAYDFSDLAADGAEQYDNLICTSESKKFLAKTLYGIIPAAREKKQALYVSKALEITNKLACDDLTENLDLLKLTQEMSWRINESIEESNKSRYEYKIDIQNHKIKIENNRSPESLYALSCALEDLGMHELYSGDLEESKLIFLEKKQIDIEIVQLRKDFESESRLCHDYYNLSRSSVGNDKTFYAGEAASLAHLLFKKNPNYQESFDFFQNYFSNLKKEDNYFNFNKK